MLRPLAIHPVIHVIKRQDCCRSSASFVKQQWSVCVCVCVYVACFVVSVNVVPATLADDTECYNIIRWTHRHICDGYCEHLIHVITMTVSLIC